MKKNMTILAALALGAGAGMPPVFAAEVPVDALRPAAADSMGNADGIEYVSEGGTLVYQGKDGILLKEQNPGASNSDRSAIVKDGQGTPVVRPESPTDTAFTMDHSLVVREGTMIMEGVQVTNTPTLESPNLTVGGNHAQLILDGAVYQQVINMAVPGGKAYASAIVVGGRDGDGTLTLKNGSVMSNTQGLFAGYPSKDTLAVPPDPNQYTDAHVAGTYLTPEEEDGRLYRDVNPQEQFSSDYVCSGDDPSQIYMSKATINILEGSRYEAGTAVYIQNAEVNIDGEGSAMIVGTRATGLWLDSSLGVGSGLDEGNYQPSAVFRVTGGALLQFNNEVYMSYASGHTEIHVSGKGSKLVMENALYNTPLDDPMEASPEEFFASSSCISLADGAEAVIPHMRMGGSISAQDERVLLVGAGCSYHGTVLDQFRNSLTQNWGTMTFEDGSLNFAPEVLDSKKDFYATLHLQQGACLINEAGAVLSVTSASGQSTFAADAGGCLVNNGRLVSDTAFALAGTLAGSGEMGKVVTEAGSTVYVGGTAVCGDRWTTIVDVVSSAGSPHFSELTLAAGTTLRFYVDGDVAATAQNTGAGTYSNLTVDAGGLTFAADGVTASLTLGPNVLKTALRRVEKALPIELVKEKDAAGSPADKTQEMQMDYQLTGEHAELFTVAQRDTLWLVLAPAAVRGYVEYGAADLLNTLWTGTGTVQDFARKAAGQAAVASRVGHEEGISLWGAGLGYFTTMGSTHGFDYNSGGYAVGADAAVLPGARVGAAFGQTFGTFKADSGTKVDQDGLMVSLYGSAEQRLSERVSWRTSAYAAYGQMENEGRTRSVDGTPGRADWDDDVWTFGVQTELRCAVTERFTVSPFVGLDYLYGAQDCFIESFSDGTSRSYDGGAMQVWRVPVGVRLEGAIALGGEQYLFPELTLAYVGDISRSNPHATVGLYGTTSRVHGNDPGRNAFMLNAGVTWKMSEQWATGASYQLEVRDSQTAQGVNGFVRYRF